MNSVLQELQSITEEQWRVIGRELEAGKNFCDIDATVVTTLQSLTSVSASLRNTWGNKKRQRYVNFFFLSEILNVYGIVMSYDQ